MTTGFHLEQYPRIVIVGAGVSGLCLGIQLKRAGIESFVILEKSDDVGGTWLDNSYPGCGCDVPSMLYSYSFAPKHDWSRKYAPQAEILEYFRECADKFKLRDHVCFGESVESATFDENARVWRIVTAAGEELEADFFVSAVGQLSRPRSPDLEGIDSFAGEAFHTARWNHEVPFKDRDVAVIGNGASAIQLIPKLAEQAKRVLVFQRTPNWITRRHDYRYPKVVQQMFRWLPGFAQLHRLWIYLTHEWLIVLYTKKGRLNFVFTWWLRFWMKRDLPQKLHSSVIPRYPAGCKRVLLSNDYLQALARENVELVTRPVERIVEKGVETKQGIHEVDTLVFATGFDSNRFLYPMKITGTDGVELHDAWQDRPTTFYGVMAPQFPNFFMLYGPNTNLGHNSVIYMLESQVRFILRVLQKVGQTPQTVEVTTEAVKAFDRELQQELRKKVWSGYVSNWYTTKSGHIVNNWCGSTLSYRRQLARVRWDQFQIQTTPSHDVAAATNS